MRTGGKARIIATGPALPGVPTLPLQPLDAASVAAHLHALGLPEDARATQQIADAFVAVRALAKDGALGALTDAHYTLALLDRVAARLTLDGAAAPADDVTQAALHEALTDLFARRVHADARVEVQDLIDGFVEPPRSPADPLVAIDGKVAVIDDVKLAVVGVPESVDALPAMTSGERAQLRAAARALELGEPVVADAAIAERVGTLYGALTGRDVHVHLMHAQSKAEDVRGRLQRALPARGARVARRQERAHQADGQSLAGPPGRRGRAAAPVRRHADAPLTGSARP
jgi:hypothetical protein